MRVLSGLRILKGKPLTIVDLGGADFCTHRFSHLLSDGIILLPVRGSFSPAPLAVPQLGHLFDCLREGAVCLQPVDAHQDFAGGNSLVGVLRRGGPVPFAGPVKGQDKHLCLACSSPPTGKGEPAHRWPLPRSCLQPTTFLACLTWRRACLTSFTAGSSTSLRITSQCLLGCPAQPLRGPRQGKAPMDYNR